MSVLILRDIDGSDLALQLKGAIEGVASNVIVNDVHNSHIDDSDDIHNHRPINVFIITPVLCQGIQEKGLSHINTFLSDRHTVLMYHCHSQQCETDLKTIMTDRDLDSSNMYHFDGTNTEGWYMAEAKIKTLLALKMEPKLRQANKFIIRPERISNDQNELLIIQLHDDLHNSRLDVKLDNTLTLGCKNIRPGVWSCDIRDLKPGQHTLTVRQASRGLGSATFTVIPPFDEFRSGLSRQIENDPRTLLSRLLRIDESDLDAELADILRESTGNAFIKLADGLLMAGDYGTRGCDFPSLLHVCARYNLPHTAQWLTTNDPELSTMLCLKDRKGLSPLDVAREAGATGVIDVIQQVKEIRKPSTSPASSRWSTHPLQPIHNGPSKSQEKRPDNDDDDEVFPVLPSPAHNTDRTSSCDSGHFSNGSVKLRHNSANSRTPSLTQKSRSFDEVTPPNYQDQSPRSQSLRKKLTDRSQSLEHVEYRNKAGTLPSESDPTRLSILMESQTVDRKKEKFQVRRQHFYEDISYDSGVQFRVQNRHKYNEPWEQDPLPGGPLPTKPHGSRPVPHSSSDSQLSSGSSRQTGEQVDRRHSESTFL